MDLGDSEYRVSDVLSATYLVPFLKEAISNSYASVLNVNGGENEVLPILEWIQKLVCETNHSSRLKKHPDKIRWPRVGRKFRLNLNKHFGEKGVKEENVAFRFIRLISSFLGTTIASYDKLKRPGGWVPMRIWVTYETTRSLKRTDMNRK